MLLAAGGSASADALFYSIGANDFGQPLRVVQIDRTAGSASALFDLNSQDAAFSGLTYNSSDGLFYAVMKDHVSPSQLVTFGLADGGAWTSVHDSRYGCAFNGIQRRIDAAAGTLPR